eukprot:TRINITY_DN1139_c0_g1_i3.p1 TRINITY_DN1139_c0_g1~~TRINITY_DN1139_c0_g1_i3.p1  ORF type:complete len:732 (+),score=133.79 TRINITY_DN1139_c0_g1_i3:308-2503(+)
MSVLDLTPNIVQPCLPYSYGEFHGSLDWNSTDPISCDVHAQECAHELTGSRSGSDPPSTSVIVSRQCSSETDQQRCDLYVDVGMDDLPCGRLVKVCCLADDDNWPSTVRRLLGLVPIGLLARAQLVLDGKLLQFDTDAPPPIHHGLKVQLRYRDALRGGATEQKGDRVYYNESFTDLALCYGEAQFHVHLAQLAKCSPVLRECLRSAVREPKLVIPLQATFDVNALEDLLQWMYRDVQAPRTVEHLVPYLNAARYFQVQGAEGEAVEQLVLRFGQSSLSARLRILQEFDDFRNADLDDLRGALLRTLQQDCSNMDQALTISAVICVFKRGFACVDGQWMCASAGPALTMAANAVMGRLVELLKNGSVYRKLAQQLPLACLIPAAAKAAPPVSVLKRLCRREDIADACAADVLLFLQVCREAGDAQAAAIGERWPPALLYRLVRMAKRWLTKHSESSDNEGAAESVMRALVLSMDAFVNAPRATIIPSRLLPRLVSACVNAGAPVPLAVQKIFVRELPRLAGLPELSQVPVQGLYPALEEALSQSGENLDALVAFVLTLAPKYPDHMTTLLHAVDVTHVSFELLSRLLAGKCLSSAQQTAALGVMSSRLIELQQQSARQQTRMDEKVALLEQRLLSMESKLHDDQQEAERKRREAEDKARRDAEDKALRDAGDRARRENERREEDERARLRRGLHHPPTPIAAPAASTASDVDEQDITDAFSRLMAKLKSEK